MCEVDMINNLVSAVNITVQSLASFQAPHLCSVLKLLQTQRELEIAECV